jgi:putative hydrolase of the HAD superfamily
MSEVRAVWTDFGGVLTPPIIETFSAFCAKQNLPPEPLLTAVLKVTASYDTDDILLPIDTPLVTEEEWLAQIGAALYEDTGLRIGGLTSIADAWFGDRPVNTAWLDRLGQLRDQGVYIGMISNMVPTWDTHWRRMVDPAVNFDGVVLSFQAGHRKPAREIFELAIEQSGIAAEHSVFVDDLPKNCDGARAAGWQAIHFTGAEAAIAALDGIIDSPIIDNPIHSKELQ